MEPTEPSAPRQHVLTLTCPDRPGIVHAVSGFYLQRGCNIVDSQQFDERTTGRFFLRMHVETSAATPTLAALTEQFATVAETFGLQWQMHDLARRARTLILVSQQGHCLDDLLFRHRTGALHADVVGVVSNHDTWRWLAEAHGVAFHHLPITSEGRQAQEDRIAALAAEHKVDLVVLARYMQVLSEGFCARFAGRIINIHHSSLPSFQGARPYHQAYERGVKIIGATAHYVTADLDEGPIIEQEVVRVDHAQSPQDLVRVGQDVERLALARAVGWHLEHRVILSGHRTVVFR